MSRVGALSTQEILEIIESLLSISTRKEAEIAELKAQLDIYKPRDTSIKMFDHTGQNVKGKVLLVFQSRTLRDILKTLLDKSDQFEVMAVEEFNDAPSACAIQHPDVCVFEISRMFNLDTQVDVLREVRSIEKNTGIITILSENDVSLIRDVVAAGSDDFLVKPIDTSRLLKVVSDIITKKRDKVAV